MKSLVPVPARAKDREITFAAAEGARQTKMVAFHSPLPEQLASFLGHLSMAQRRDVYAVQGTFLEVRALVGTARLLDSFLREAPHAAARGRTTFREFFAEKDDILRDIRVLREKVNRSASNVCLILPRVPQLRNEEVRRENAHPLRAS
jgi:hypothetical protein